MKLGNRLRELRMLKGVTQVELSEITGMSKGLISLMEGNDRNVTPFSAILLSCALDVPVISLYETIYKDYPLLNNIKL